MQSKWLTIFFCSLNTFSFCMILNGLDLTRNETFIVCLLALLASFTALLAYSLWEGEKWTKQ